MISATRFWSLGSTAAVGVLLSACQDIGPVVAARVDFVAQPPASVATSQTMAPVTVAFLTEDGEIATTATGYVQISLVTADTAARLSGTKTVTAANGVATFSDLSVAAKAASGYKLVARTAVFDSVVSSPFEITVGPAAKLRFDGVITHGRAGSTLPPVAVIVSDADGNFVSNATAEITVSGPLLFGTTTKSAVAGRATFTDLSTHLSSYQYTLAASAPGLTSATSNPFLVSPGELVRLVFGPQPSSAAAGVPLSTFTVRCVDEYGNGSLNPPGGSMQIAVSLGNNPTGATLSGTLAVWGFTVVTSFTNVSIDKPGTGYTLVASMAPPLPPKPCAPVTSAPFNITP